MRAIKNLIQVPELGYFEALPKPQRDLVRELLSETINKIEGWRSTEETFEDIECRSRDGFICSSHNKGGLRSLQFTDLSSLWGSGTQVAHKRAQAEIERQIEYSLECARELFYEANTSKLNSLGITSAEQVSYHDLYERKQGQLAEEFSEYEQENLSDDGSSIMFEVRFMYHGCENSIHSASVSCAVNTEGPYHRPRISWAPDVFCEGAKEVEITWRNESGLKRKLTKALKQTSAEVF